MKRSSHVYNQLLLNNVTPRITCSLTMIKNYYIYKRYFQIFSRSYFLNETTHMYLGEAQNHGGDGETDTLFSKHFTIYKYILDFFKY